jgi:hypothetical protein
MRLPSPDRSVLPPWVGEQARLGRGQKGYATKLSLIRRYAKELDAKGERATHERIREMLDALGRNYKTSSSEITMALTLLHRHGVLEPYSNGRRVEAEGRVYRSIRAAAKEEGCAVETVRKRIRAGRPGWRYLD